MCCRGSDDDRQNELPINCALVKFVADLPPSIKPTIVILFQSTAPHRTVYADEAEMGMEMR